MLIESNEKSGFVEVEFRMHNEQDEGGRRMTVAQNQLDTHTRLDRTSFIIPYQVIHTI